MKRRAFLRLATVGAASAALPAWRLHAAGTPAAAGKDKPNVLFIAIDDLNDWTGCLGGHPDTKTPHLDALAARGALFTNEHCAAPLCNPSRAALMSGLGPATTGVYNNTNPWRKSVALAQAVTLPQHFMANGYKAIGSGKIYHGSYPDPASWDDYHPSKTQTVPPTTRPPRVPMNGLQDVGNLDWGPMPFGDDEMGDWKVASWCIEQLKQKHDKPLFLACGFSKPHLPWYVPQKYFDMFPLEGVHLPVVKEGDLDDVPPAGQKVAAPRDHLNLVRHDQWRQAVQGYLATIAFCDAMVGRMVEGLDRSPLARETLVVLWSDHGWHLGEKLHWRKFTPWEEATRNILAFAVPGVTKAGGRCDRPASHLDIYPTLAELCGLPPREGLDGTSLLPWLKDPAAPSDRAVVSTVGRALHSVRSQRWRYIRYPDGTEELYDHDKDPNEWTNLAKDAQFDAVKKDLARRLPTTDAAEIERDAGEIERAKKQLKRKAVTAGPLPPSLALAWDD